MVERTKWLVSTEWLKANLDNCDVTILDGSWYLPAAERDPIAEYTQEHIPGAQFFDIDAVADLSTDLPHMLPDEAVFNNAMADMGICEGQTVVVYDGAGLMTSPRLWWTFRVMGFDKVFILDGGLPQWKAEGRALTDIVPSPPTGSFKARLDAAAVSDYAAMMAAVSDENIEIVDARSQERWRGLGPEPRPNLPSGRIPGSKNVPFGELIDANGCLRNVDTLRECFISAGVDLEKRIVTSCGSGATAAILTLALDTLGLDNLSLYDGSWTEWAATDGALIESDA